MTRTQPTAAALADAIDLAKSALAEPRPDVRAALVVHARAAIRRARSWSGDGVHLLRTSPATTTRGHELGARSAADEVELAFSALARVLHEAERADDGAPLTHRLPVTDQRRRGPGRAI